MIFLIAGKLGVNPVANTIPSNSTLASSENLTKGKYFLFIILYGEVLKMKSTPKA